MFLIPHPRMVDVVVSPRQEFFAVLCPNKVGWDHTYFMAMLA